MGQYYRPIFLNKNWKNNKKSIIDFTFNSWAFSNGAKLVESCYVHNHYVEAIANLLATTYYGSQFVFCGDYADTLRTKGKNGMAIINYRLDADACKEIRTKLQGILPENDFSHLMEESYNKVVIPYDETLWNELTEISVVGVDYELNLYEEACEWESKHEAEVAEFAKTKVEYDLYKYIVNFDKKEYVEIPEYEEDEWNCHPLTLLCAEGNGRGGGDYHEQRDPATNDPIDNGFKYVGRWAFDHIGVTNDESEFDGFTKIEPGFKVDW